MLKKDKKSKLEIVRAPFGYYKEFELKCKGHPLAELSREIRAEGVKKEKRELLIETKEEKHCEGISTTDVKQGCYYDVAIASKNRALCDKIIDATARENCQNKIV